MSLNRRDIVAAALAGAGPGAAYDPIRVQNLLFLIDRVVADRIGGPFFDFKPGTYGPFDGAVYDVIGEMAAGDDALIDGSNRCSRFLLTEAGIAKGNTVRASFEPAVADYFARAARWVRLMPHRRMLAAIRQAYPDMAGNSGARDRNAERFIRRWNPFLRGMASAFDLGGTMFRSPGHGVGPASDGDAIRDVWREVGESLENAMVGFGDSERLW